MENWNIKYEYRGFLEEIEVSAENILAAISIGLTEYQLTLSTIIAVEHV